MHRHVCDLSLKDLCLRQGEYAETLSTSCGGWGRVVTGMMYYIGGDLPLLFLFLLLGLFDWWEVFGRVGWGGDCCFCLLVVSGGCEQKCCWPCM